MISNRLKSIAKYVSKNDKLIDIEDEKTKQNLLEIINVIFS